MKHPLQTKLWLAFVSLALLVLVGAGVSLQSVKAQQALLGRGIHPSLHVLNLAEQLRESVSDTQRLSFQAGIERREDLLYQAGATAANFFAVHEALAAAMRELPGDSPNHNALLSYHEHIAGSFRRIMASSLSLLAEALERGEMQEAWMAQLRLASQNLSAELDSFVAIAHADLDEQIALGSQRLERMTQILWLSIAVAAFGLVAFLLFMLRQVSRPMRGITGFVDRACADPLGTAERHVASRDDEIGALGGGINHLLDRLQQLAVSRDFFDRVFESAHVALLVLDGENIVRRENRTARALAGGTLAGRNIDVILANDSCPANCPETCENFIVAANGSRVAVLVSAAAIDDPVLGLNARVMALTDISAHKQAEVELLHRSRILKAVAAASRSMLARDEERTAIHAALGIVAQAAEADRAYLFEVAPPAADSPEGVINQLYAWCAAGVAPQAGTAYMSPPWHQSLPRWVGLLNAGYAVEGPVAEFPAEERAFFAAQGVVSLLCVPIFMDQTLWGFAGFDDCHGARRWAEFEQEALASVGTDIAQAELRRRDADALKLSAQVFENSGEAIIVTDGAGAILSANRAFSEVTGYDAAEVLGKNPSVLKSGRHAEDFYRQMWAELNADGQWQGEIWNRRKNGEVYPEWLNISAVRDRAGRVSHYIGIFSDITERKTDQARIEFLAHHDSLTGLPNRVLLLERLERDIVRARREGGLVAVLYLDLDNFKRINDSLGHAAGDRLLRVVAERLRGCVREIDTVCRQGGDEFIVILGDLATAEMAAQVAGKMLRVLDEPVDIGSQRLQATTSIGIAVFPADGRSATTLLKNADTAMYYAKEGGRNALRFFENEMNQRAQERLQLEALLREALPSGQLSLHYQPLVRVGDGAIVGAEALLRWQTPELGMISPARFIPVAEESGLIVPIGAWVLDEACRQGAAWAEMGHPLKIAVNVSAVQVKRTDLVATVQQALAASALPPERLELEITESLLMGDDEATRRMLENLVGLGVRISIDDFGTGYSNLAYLHRFSVDKLKIDQAFVRQAAHGSEAVAIINAVVHMARSLGMTVLAEGVETAEQLDMLTVLRCDEVQGYLLGRPAPAEALTDRLNGVVAKQAA